MNSWIRSAARVHQLIKYNPNSTKLVLLGTEVDLKRKSKMNVFKNALLVPVSECIIPLTFLTNFLSITSEDWPQMRDIPTNSKV